MSKEREITYVFKFEDDSQLLFSTAFDKNNQIITQNETSQKDWTKLEHNKCDNCPLDPAKHEYCPVALNLDDIVEKTKSKISHTKATVLVKTPERDILKKTDTQTGLLSLFGLIMATSGCPHLDWFRPLANFHLPFSTVEETTFRILSMHLVSEFLDNKDSNINGIKEHYAEVEKVNLCFIERIRSYTKGDADANAVAALDLFAKLFEFEQSSDFSGLRKFFNTTKS